MDPSQNSNKILDISNQITVKKSKKSDKTVATEKPKTKRIITNSNKWPVDLTLADLTLVNAMTDISDNIFIDNSSTILFYQQVRQKISGYRGQDVEKGVLNVEKLVCLQDVLDLFKTSELLCYYCRDPVLLLYEFVREPKQWTLERLDNSLGHNRDNVVLACLHCNLRRRCMASERYVQTKQIAKIVKIR